ncbi:MAG TPA: TIM barrel protein [Candidatus Acidoferrales bacterium]|nr:TIM barrel protein [Candidatus Acidoferrales bacterium]
MTRRQMLGAAAAVFARTSVGSEKPRSPNLGTAPTGFGLHRRVQPIDPVDLTHELGLGVVETRLAGSDADAAKALRQKVEGFGMRVILDTPLPRADNDVERFDTAVAASKAAGAISLHAAMTQRRYEEFDTFEAFKARFEACQKQVALAEPVLRKHRLKLGIENHKGWRSAEQAAWLTRLGSEWVGVHLDFGNNIALCEDPEQTLANLAPYAIAAHLKDMAVQPYEDGFVLSEVPLGEGILDLSKWVRTLQARDAAFPFDLETITRDPLKIPIFTKKYWATFDDSYSPLPGRDMARIFDIVRKNPPKSPLPHVTGLSPADQARLEDENNRKSIEYARAKLGL